MKKQIFTMLVLSSLLFSSCKYGWEEGLYRKANVNTRASAMKELTAETVPSSPSALSGKYTVAVISDVHFGAKAGNGIDNISGRFLDWLKTLSEKNELPAFIICLGDIAECGTKSEIQNYADFIKLVEDTYAIKTYTILGNHDLYNSGWNNWKNIVAPYTSFYHFTTKTFSWYFVDSASGSLGTNQYEKLKDVMKKDTAPKIVCSHYPVYAGGNFYFCLQNTVERNSLITLFAENNVKVALEGHTHIYCETNFGSFMEETLPGYLEKGKWELLSVDEDAGTAVSVLCP